MMLERTETTLGYMPDTIHSRSASSLSAHAAAHWWGVDPLLVDVHSGV